MRNEGLEEMGGSRGFYVRSKRGAAGARVRHDTLERMHWACFAALLQLSFVIAASPGVTHDDVITYLLPLELKVDRTPHGV